MLEDSQTTFPGDPGIVAAMFGTGWIASTYASHSFWLRQANVLGYM